MKLLVLTCLLFDILISTSLGQSTEDSATISTPPATTTTTITPPSTTTTIIVVSPSDTEPPLLPVGHVATQPLSKPLIVITICFIIFFLSLIACIYITRNKQYWFRFVRIPT